MNAKRPIEVGERIIVQGITHAQATVKNVTWVENEVRWKITIDWGTWGTSKVYDHDENKIWYRYQVTN